MALSSAAIRLAQSFYFFRVSTKRNNNSYVNYFLRVGRSMQSRVKREVWISCNVLVVVVIRTAATHSACKIKIAGSAEKKKLQALSLFPIASLSVENA